MKNDDTPIYPLSGWNIGPLAHYGVIAFQPHYVISDIAPDEMRQEDKYFGLTIAQAHELKEALQKAIDRMENEAIPVPNKEKN